MLGVSRDEISLPDVPKKSGPRNKSYLMTKTKAARIRDWGHPAGAQRNYERAGRDLRSLLGISLSPADTQPRPKLDWSWTNLHFECKQRLRDKRPRPRPSDFEAVAIRSSQGLQRCTPSAL